MHFLHSILILPELLVDFFAEMSSTVLLLLVGNAATIKVQYIPTHITSYLF